MIQPKKGFLQPQDFINGANEPSTTMVIGGAEDALAALGITPPAPAPVPAVVPETQAEAATPEPAAATADQPVAAAEAPAPAPAATPEKTRTTTKAKEKTAPAKPKAPWDDASDKLMTGINWRHSEQLHKKLEWVKDNVPKHSSLQKIIDKAVEDYVTALIAKHYDPEAE
jgi:hypothetical protein